MSWPVRFCFTFLLFSLYTCSAYAMLCTGSVIHSPDQSRYITLLGHYHKQVGPHIEAHQLDDLVAICKQGVAGGKKIHILYEEAGDFIKPFFRQKSVLIDLEAVFEAAEVPDCYIENVEIRDVSSAADHIFMEKGKVLSDETTRDEGSKPFNELTFEDLFDEFTVYASGLEPYAQQLVRDHPECRQAYLVRDECASARDSLDRIKAHLKKIGYPVSTLILNFARERQEDCDGMYSSISHAFSRLFDLVIFRRLMQLDPDMQPIVIAGAAHTRMVEQLFCGALMWKSGLFYSSNYFTQVPIPLTYCSLRAVILNETQLAQVANDTYKYLAGIKLVIGERCAALYKSFLSNN